MSDNILEIRNVSKIYGSLDSGLVALKDFSLSLPKSPASIVTVAGESG